ncbi:MAG: gluconate 2-dehydrogenase subunit 3 family protein, partial [Acidobacteria bacterium]|nr:gluconate 2-dehydrogenase subunit 3 family protein [Acidobacteriota bacterium]
RLIPTDAGGPGASEAGAVRYIDRALAGALVGSREAYRTGLAALDRYAGRDDAALLGPELAAPPVGLQAGERDRAPVWRLSHPEGVHGRGLAVR